MKNVSQHRALISLFGTGAKASQIEKVNIFEKTHKTNIQKKINKFEFTFLVLYCQFNSGFDLIYIKNKRSDDSISSTVGIF
jgi:hypothetical protein